MANADQKTPSIREQTLEHIARHLGDHGSGPQIVGWLQSWGVPSSLIEYPNTKWRMVYSVLNHYAYSAEKKDREMLFKIIGEMLHPLMFNGSKLIADKTAEDFNIYLEYDNIVAFYDEDLKRYTLFQNRVMSKEDEEEIIAGELFVQEQEELEFLRLTENKEKISTLRKAYQVFMNIVEVFCDNPSKPSHELNNAYVQTKKLITDAVRDLRLYVSSVNGVQRIHILGSLKNTDNIKNAMDTVAIKIYGPRKFQITNTSLFLPELTRREYVQLSPTEKQSTRLYLRHFILKPPYQDGYLPKVDIFETLTKSRDAVQYILKAEFSVPKLLYRNSLQEVSELDLNKVLSAFKKALGGVGVVIESDTIANARVSAVHFCKNVLLPQNIRIQEALAALQRVDINKVVDVTEKESKNGGRVLHIYSGTIERVFYDKIADATRPKVKRKDKGQINHEREVIERYGLQSREVFRYEYRVKKAQTVMREVNSALGREPKTFVAFKDLFTPNLCKTMVLKSWRGLIRRPENQLALLGPADDLALLLHILAQAKKLGGDAHSMNRALISYGLARAIRDHGAKEARRAIFSVWNTDHTERLTRKIEASAELTLGLPYSNTIALIDSAFARFELIDLALLEKGI